ncbi:MAG: hypothetical protein ABSG57_01950 [Candidatus Bathyarchaeia archaeon]|jgi:hypothetical protein
MSGRSKSRSGNKSGVVGGGGGGGWIKLYLLPSFLLPLTKTNDDVELKNGQIE